MRTLYFDIDGTILREDDMTAKAHLGAGRFEALVRAVGFVEDPHRRVRHIDLGGDWWYADDLAAYYFDLEGEAATRAREAGRRVHLAEPNGDGRGLARWLEGLVPARGP